MTPADWAPLPPEVAAVMDRQVEVIEQTYPAWRVEWLTLDTGAPSGWRATRHVPLNQAELAAGLVAWIVAADHIALVAMLSAQDGIAHQLGYAIRDYGPQAWVSSPGRPW